MSAVIKEARATLTLAVPIILGQVSQMLMAVIDSAMVGHLGAVPLAASSFAGSVFALFYLGALGLCMPVSVYVSRAHGGGEPRECAEWLRHGLALAGSAGLVSAVCMEILGTHLGGLGQPAEVVAAAQPFFSLIALSLVPALAFQGFRQYAESMGRPWLPMAIMMAGVGVNAGLNWLLIYGNGGFPALGLAGAGIATLTARLLDLLALWWCLRRSRKLRPAWPAVWVAPLDGGRLRQLLGIGLPASGQLLCEAGAFTVGAWMMGRIGTVALAAHQIALCCASMTFMFPLGVAMAAGMRVGRAIGAEERHRVRAIGYGAFAMAASVMGMFALVLWLGGGFIAGRFVRDGAVVALATRLLAVAALFQLFDGCQVVGAGLLRGLADMKVPTAITFVAYWCVMLPVAYVGGVMAGNPVGVWRALVFGLAGAAILLFWRFNRQTRRLAERGPVSGGI